MLPCPKCGFNNELGRIFCHQCGTKLDLDAIKPPSRGGKRIKRQRQWSIARAVGWTIRLVVFGLIVWGIYLLFQVPEVRRIPVGDTDLRGYYRGRDKLELAMARRQPIEVTLTEGQINAFVDTQGFGETAGRGIRMLPTNLQIELGTGSVTAVIVGKIELFKLTRRLYFSFTGNPVVNDGAFRLEPESARIGSLPILRLVLQKTGLIQSYYKQLYGGLSDEARLLNNCESITLGDGKVTFNYRPPPAGK
ncbi:hypothetical protein HQ590_06005 [bacterium]|nr:hypothetical protein [bacterium]